MLPEKDWHCAYGTRVDLQQDVRSVSAMLAGRGDLRNCLFRRFAARTCHLEYEGQEKLYGKLVLRVYVSTRHLPAPWRQVAANALLALSIMTMPRGL